MSEVSKLRGQSQSADSIPRPPSSSGSSDSSRDQLVKSVSTLVIGQTIQQSRSSIDPNVEAFLKEKEKELGRPLHPWEISRFTRRAKGNMFDVSKLNIPSASAAQSRENSSTASSTPPQPLVDPEELTRQIGSLPPKERQEVMEAVETEVKGQLDTHAEEGLFERDAETTTRPPVPPKTPTKVLRSADNTIKQFFTPKKPDSRSPTARKLDFDSEPVKTDSDTSSKPPEGGPNRVAIILLTFAAVLFLAHTAAYGFPSFGKIKGWPGATAS